MFARFFKNLSWGASLILGLSLVCSILMRACFIIYEQHHPYSQTIEQLTYFTLVAIVSASLATMVFWLGYRVLFRCKAQAYIASQHSDKPVFSTAPLFFAALIWFLVMPLVWLMDFFILSDRMPDLSTYLHHPLALLEWTALLVAGLILIIATTLLVVTRALGDSPHYGFQAARPGESRLSLPSFCAECVFWTVVSTVACISSVVLVMHHLFIPALVIPLVLAGIYHLLSAHALKRFMHRLRRNPSFNS